MIPDSRLSLTRFLIAQTGVPFYLGGTVAIDRRLGDARRRFAQISGTSDCQQIKG